MGSRDAIVDLQAPIDCLRSLRSDLEVYYWEQSGDEGLPGTRRDQIRFWIRVLADRTSALEGVVLQKGSPRLLLEAAEDEHAGVVAAVRVLDQWISEEDGFAQVAAAVATILAAADQVGLAAAAGTPLPRLDRPGV
jgi:hypothetical protein